jgi:hypothetical protein
VGFYTHVVGLGASPDNTVFNGAKGGEWAEAPAGAR